MDLAASGQGPLVGKKLSCSRMTHLYEVSHGTSTSITAITGEPTGLSGWISISSHMDTLRAEGLLKFPVPILR